MNWMIWMIYLLNVAMFNNGEDTVRYNGEDAVVTLGLGRV